MGFTITGVVTQVIKMGVGRPRPDMLSRCQPYEGAHDHPVFGLSDYTICTQTDKRLLDDGFKSFPSGHSSCELAVLFFVIFAGVWIEDQANAAVVFVVSFAGMGFLTFYLAGKMHLADVKGHRTRAWLALSPLLASTMVAVSRTADNRHHWQDVTVGSLLGLSIAWVAYRAYFPALSSTNAHLPLAPPHYGDHDPSYNDNRQLANGYEDVDEEERIGLGADNAEEEEGDDASVDSVVPREEYRR
ncbi:hypothetical protein QFC24_000710 [Naganishia onofrii]|uniref:Uncharacterized protein n=1 Tax=Naganishia onofrii TaxID=1851511 RepID=A0ACC2XTV8_9TREE|nr:hypothetical protein QFC24_000710 [Naganishia onofrii]